MKDFTNLMQILMTTFLILWPKAQAKNFASSADMEMLLDTEAKVLKSIRNYVQTEKRRLDFLQEYLNRSKLEYEIAIKDIPHYLENPLNAYTTIIRLGPDLEFVENILKNKTALKIPKAVFPTQEDLSDAIIAFYNVYTEYGLKISDVANGILNATVSQSKEVYTEVVTSMTASECYMIGIKLYSAKLYQDAVQWFLEAYKKLEEDNIYSPLPIEDVISRISETYHHLGDFNNYKVWVEKFINLKPDAVESMAHAKYLQVTRNRGPQLPLNRINYNQRPENKPKLCFRELKTAFNTSKRTCHYAYGPHPFLKLARLKAEILHIDPDLVMYHQVLSEDEMQFLKKSSKPVMWNTTSSDRPIFRNSEIAQFNDRSSEIVARISKRVLLISEMSAEDCEDLKIINYGIGGSYKRHWDFVLRRKTDKAKWNRIGTIMFYLSDVDQGGATIFPILGQTIYPVKGAALVWRNQLPSGDNDLSLLHSGCPVMRGNKWIAIKWPHQPIKYECPYWVTEKGIVTEKTYKEILKHRKERYIQLEESLGGVPVINQDSPKKNRKPKFNGKAKRN